MNISNMSAKGGSASGGKKALKYFGAIATILTTLSLGSFASASVSISSPINASISSDSATGSSVALPALVLTESAAADIPVGTLTWSMPSGFVLDMTSVANVVYGGNGLNGAGTVSFPDNTHFSVSVTATSTSASTLSIGTLTPLKVKVTSGTPFSASGNVRLTSGSLNGVATTTTSFGQLTQVAGAANKLAFTVAPPASTTVGSSFSATVGVQDQFGNLLSAESGRSISLFANLLASTTLGSLSGTTVLTDSSGQAVFSGLSFSAVNQISLSATSTGLTGVTSAVINILAATSTTTPPSVGCNLQNGKLVKVAGSPTIYMVVNCVLRPFTTPAIFHAKGKKFSDIVVINGQVFAGLHLGKDVGNGDDNDDTIVSPTVTPPVVSGLPEGSIVKLPGNPTIYMVSGGVLKPFTSLTVFKANKKDFKNVITISAEQFASMQVGDPVNFPDGTLVKGSNNTVFVVINGQLMGITSMNVLNKHGWSLKNLIKANDNDLKDLKHGGNKED